MQRLTPPDALPRHHQCIRSRRWLIWCREVIADLDVFTCSLHPRGAYLSYSRREYISQRIFISTRTMIAPAVARDQRKQSYLHICPIFNSSNTIAVSTRTLIAPTVTRDQRKQSYLHIRPIFNSNNTVAVLTRTMIAPTVTRDQRKQSYLHSCPTLYSSNTITVSTGTMIAPAVAQDQRKQSYLHYTPVPFLIPTTPLLYQLAE